MADYSTYAINISDTDYPTTYNNFVTQLETDVTSLNSGKISQGGTLTSNLNGGGYEITNITTTATPSSAASVSYVNSVVTMGGSPSGVAITDLDNGAGTANQLIGINAAGTAVVGISHSQRVAVLDSASSGLNPIGAPDIFKISDDFYVSNQFYLSVANDVFFVGNASGSSTVYTSTDGETWTARTMPSSQDWGYVCWTGTNYVCVNATGTAAAYSTNYISWTASTLATSSTSCTSIATDGAGKVLTSSTGTIQLSTDHGVTWGDVAGVVGEFVGYVGGLFVAIGASSVNYKTSPDGSSWTARTAPDSKTFAIGASYNCVHNGVLISPMSDGTIYKTTDGINWTLLGTSPFAYQYTRTLIINGVYFIFGQQSQNAYFYSHDFVTFHPLRRAFEGASTSAYFAANSTGSVLVAMLSSGAYSPSYCSKTDAWLFEV